MRSGLLRGRIKAGEQRKKCGLTTCDLIGTVQQHEQHTKNNPRAVVHGGGGGCWGPFQIHKQMDKCCYNNSIYALVQSTLFEYFEMIKSAERRVLLY